MAIQEHSPSPKEKESNLHRSIHQTNLDKLSTYQRRPAKESTMHPNTTLEDKRMIAYQDYKTSRQEYFQNQIQHELARIELKDYQRKIMNDYYGYLNRQGNKLQTKYGKVHTLRQLLMYFNKPIDQITKTDIDEYLAHLNSKYKPGTILERRMFLIQFFQWYFDKPRDELDLIKGIKIVKEKGIKLPEELISPEEIKKIVQVANNFRDKALVMTLYESGARIGEFLQLRIKHLDFANKEYCMITIPMGKTHSRKVPLIYSVPHIQNWLNSHPKRDDPEQALFIQLKRKKGHPIGNDGVKVLLKDLAKRAEVPKNIYPHLLRHSRLTELGKELKEMELRIFAGWCGSSNMPEVYIHLAGSDVSNKLLANAGLIDSETVENGKKVLHSLRCPRCDYQNSAETMICKCGFILDIKIANQQFENNNQASKKLSKFFDHDQVQTMFKMLEKLQMQIDDLKNGM